MRSNLHACINCHVACTRPRLARTNVCVFVGTVHHKMVLLTASMHTVVCTYRCASSLRSAMNHNSFIVSFKNNLLDQKTMACLPGTQALKHTIREACLAPCQTTWCRWFSLNRRFLCNAEATLLLQLGATSRTPRCIVTCEII